MNSVVCMHCVCVCSLFVSRGHVWVTKLKHGRAFLLPINNKMGTFSCTSVWRQHNTVKSQEMGHKLLSFSIVLSDSNLSGSVTVQPLKKASPSNHYIFFSVGSNLCYQVRKMATFFLSLHCDYFRF